MNKDELMAEFERHVAWLQRNIPPDDIYMFAEQTLMAARFFMHKWASNCPNVREVIAEDKPTQQWSKNVINVLNLQNRGEDSSIDFTFNMDFLHED